MAQTGYTPILIYSSSTASQAPAAGNLTNSALGSELAINITDGKLFYKDNANAIQVIGWKVVPATAGGTGQTVYAVGDILYADTTTSLAKLADVATGNALISGGVGVAPSWGKIGLTTHVSGTLPTANGGTNLTSFTANGVMYASSTSALATGSALTFNGTDVLAIVGSNPSFRGNPSSTGLYFDNIAVGKSTYIRVSSASSVDTTAITIASSGAVSLATALGAASGGTGQSTYAVGDILYASASNALSRLADVATGNALISGGVGVAPSWGKIGLTTHVSGTLPIANGGTGQTSFTNNYVHYGSFSTSANFQFDGNNVYATGAFYKYAETVTSVATGTNTTTDVLKLAANGTYLVSAWGNSNGGDQTYSGVAIVTLYNDGFTYRAAITSLMTKSFSWVSISNNSGTTNGQITFQQTSGFTGNVWFKAQLLVSS